MITLDQCRAIVNYIRGENLERAAEYLLHEFQKQANLPLADSQSVFCKVRMLDKYECGAPATHHLRGVGPVCNDHALMAIAASMKDGLTTL